MLSVTNLSKRFGARRILEAVSFGLGPGERLGLIGPSGSGKTTLLRIIAGEEPANEGSVTLARGVRLGYLRQGYAGHERRPVSEVFLSLFSVWSGAAELATLAERLAAESDPARAARIEAAYTTALARLEAGAAAEERIERARGALGVRRVAPHEPISRLSGGEQTKLGLLELLAAAPDLLLLDEPTNNLDLTGLEWLDGYLDSFPGPVLLVSHDRAFLDAQVTDILELSPETGRVEVFPGGYTDYAEEKARRNAEAWAAYGRQQKREQEIQRAISGLKSKAQRIENSTIHFHWRKRAIKVARRAVTLQRRLERELDETHRIEKPVRLPFRVRAEIVEGERGGARMLAAEQVTVAAGGRVLLRDVDLVVGWGDRVAIVGPNGSGKTTLLRALLGEVAVESGVVRLAERARTGYLAQRSGEPGADGTAAWDGVTPLEIIRRARPLSEGEARRFLHRFLFTGEQPLTPVSRLSYGERRRLDLARLVAAGTNLLVLDEPTNHLDIASREAFELALDHYHGALLLVSHDRYLIGRIGARVLAVQGERLVAC